MITLKLSGGPGGIVAGGEPAIRPKRVEVSGWSGARGEESRGLLESSRPAIAVGHPPGLFQVGEQIRSL